MFVYLSLKHNVIYIAKVQCEKEATYFLGASAKGTSSLLAFKEVKCFFTFQCISDVRGYAGEHGSIRL